MIEKVLNRICADQEISIKVAASGLVLFPWLMFAMGATLGYATETSILGSGLMFGGFGLVMDLIAISI